MSSFLPFHSAAPQVMFGKGRPAGKYQVPIDFGAIGSGLSAAIGVAMARGSDKALLIDGEGSLNSTSRNWRPSVTASSFDLHSE